MHLCERFQAFEHNPKSYTFAQLRALFSGQQACELSRAQLYTLTQTSAENNISLLTGLQALQYPCRALFVLIPASAGEHMTLFIGEQTHETPHYTYSALSQTFVEKYSILLA